MLGKTTAYAKKLFDEVSEIVGSDKFTIAGGAIRNFVEQANEPVIAIDLSLKQLNDGSSQPDIDLFFNCSEEWQDSKDTLLNKGYKIVKERTRSAVFSKYSKPDIDLVLLELSTPEGIIADFDFTNCCVAYSKDGLVTHPDFFVHVKNKELKINMVKLPYHTLQRAAKFKKKGYSIDTNTKLDIFDYAMKAPWGFEKEKEYLDATE